MQVSSSITRDPQRSTDVKSLQFDKTGDIFSRLEICHLSLYEMRLVGDENQDQVGIFCLDHGRPTLGLERICAALYRTLSREDINNSSLPHNATIFNPRSMWLLLYTDANILPKRGVGGVFSSDLSFGDYCRFSDITTSQTRGTLLA